MREREEIWCQCWKQEEAWIHHGARRLSMLSRLHTNGIWHALAQQAQAERADFVPRAHVLPILPSSRGRLRWRPCSVSRHPRLPPQDRSSLVLQSRINYEKLVEHMMALGSSSAPAAPIGKEPPEK